MKIYQIKRVKKHKKEKWKKKGTKPKLMRNKFKRTTNLGVVLLGFHTKNYVPLRFVLSFRCNHNKFIFGGIILNIIIFN